MTPEPEPAWTELPLRALARRIETRRLELSEATPRQLRDHLAPRLFDEPALCLEVAKALAAAVAAEPSLGPSPAAWSGRALAECQLYTGHLRAASETYKKTLRHARRCGARGLEGQTLVGAIHVASMLGEHARAARMARRADTLLSEVSDHEYRIKLLISLGNADYQQERLGAAERNYARAARLLEGAHRQDSTAAALAVNRAVLATQRLQLAHAQRLFDEGEDLARQLDLEMLQAQCRLNRAYVERFRGDYRRALELLLSAERAFQRTGAKDLEISCVRSRAEISLELGLNREVIQATAQLTTGFLARGMGLDAAICEEIGARAQLASGRVDESLHSLRGLVRRYRGSPPRAIALSLLIAEAQRKLGAFAAASRRTRAALAAAEAQNLPLLMNRAGVATARVMLDRGRAREAEATLKPFLAKLASLPPGHRRDFWHLAGQISLALERFPEARRRLVRALEYDGRVRDATPDGDLEHQLGRTTDLIFDGLLRLELARQRSPAAFRWLERAQGEVAGANAGLPPSPGVIEIRADLQSSIHRLDELEMEGRAPNDPLIRNARARSRRLERTLTELKRERSITALGPRPVPSLREPGRVGLDRVRLRLRTLGDDILIGVEHGLDRELRVLGGALPGVCRDLERFDFQLESFAFECRRPRANVNLLHQSVSAILRDLHKTIIEPLDLPCLETLQVVPSGILHRVPFELLTDGEQCLMDRSPVIRTSPIPAVSTGDALRESEPPETTDRRITFCGMRGSGGAQVAHEVEASSAHYCDSETEVLFDPSTATVLERLAESRVVHLATHGEFRSDNPGFSRLATGDGGLFVGDLDAVRSRAQLVILSACDSGRLDGAHPESVSSVAHRILATGAQTVVAGLWPVEDRATGELMIRFHRIWSQGHATAAAAARQAARELRRDWSHPFYWGAFATFERVESQ